MLPIVGAYGASKWALEAIAEGLAIETGHFGIEVSIVQPGAVSANGAEQAMAFFKEGDPYLPQYQRLGALRGEVIAGEEVAAAVADTIEQAEPPLRVPAGAPAGRALKARKEAPESEPFMLVELDW